jgi:PAS domain S-box-containing protein
MQKTALNAQVVRMRFVCVSWYQPRMQPDLDTARIEPATDEPLLSGAAPSIVGGAQELTPLPVQLDARLQEFDELLRNLLSKPLPHFAQQVMFYLCRALNCIQGVLYVPEYDDDGPTGYFVPAGAYACAINKLANLRFLPGQTLAGQVAKSQQPIVVTDLTSAQFEIRSSLARLYPQALLLYPIQFNNAIQGVVELVSLHKPLPQQLDLLTNFLKSAAAVLQSVLNNLQMRGYLAKMEHLATELKTKGETLERQSQELSLARQELLEKRLQEERDAKQRDYGAHLIIQAGPIAIFQLDAKGGIISANIAATSLVQRSADELFKLSIFEAVGAKATTVAQFAQELAEARQSTFDYLVKRADGTFMFCQAELVPLAQVGEKQFALYLVDVTGRYAHFTL